MGTMSPTAVSRILFLLALSPTVSAQEWRFYGGDAGGTRSSPLKQINRHNVGSLKRAWTYHMGEVDRGSNETDRHHIAPFESTPIMIDGALYFSTPSNRVIALDAETGKEIWRFDPQAGRAGPRQFFQHRGVAYWHGKAEDHGRILYGTFDGRLIALDARSGKPCPEFGKNGTVDLRAGVADAYPGAEYSVTSPPAVYHDLVITGAAVPEYPSKGPSGDVRAFDVRSGKADLSRWCCRSGLNTRPPPYQGGALPLSYGSKNARMANDGANAAETAITAPGGARRQAELAQCAAGQIMRP